MLCLMQIKIIKSKLFYYLMLILLLNIACLQNLKAKSIGLSEWLDIRNRVEDFKFIVNEPFNSEKLCKTQIIYDKPLLGSRTEGFGDFNMTREIYSRFCGELPTYFYRSNIIFYSPKLGSYLRLHGIKSRSRLRKTYGKCDGDGYTGYALQISFQRINNTNKDLPVIPQTLRPNELSNGEIEKLYKIAWYETFGHDCSFDYKNPNMRCFNELDTHDYERFFFMGNQDNDKKDKYYSKILKTTRTEYYESGLNVNVISKYKLDKNNPNKNNFENLFISMIKENAEQKKNDKVLIIVPKNQVKLFIKTIKKIPDNSLNNIKGYVWFEPKWRGYPVFDEKPYNPKKYDVIPNDEYDAELSRISNGNLKAKYGRYLTKERYSEDYIAPSIYGNNYNDKPEW